MKAIMVPFTPVWFITAASSGFGKEIALCALKRGHKVIATARNLNKLKDLENAGADTLTLDVTAPSADIEAIASFVYTKHGRVDYLVNAAGYILEGTVEEVTSGEVFANFNTNVFGTLNTIRAFLPHLRSQPVGANNVRSTIVTFGSLGSWEAGASYAVYAMTKSCASSLAQSLRIELKPFGIEATACEPGYFRTGFLNPGSRASSAKRLEVYEDESTPSGLVRKMLKDNDGKQLGDVKKGAEVCVDVLTRTGIAQGKELPPRLVLGSDCVKVIREHCNANLQLVDEWETISTLTDHPQ
jgi:NAD(P)-dependent dehydrogenase (short-subunit alcohol dehydrogenase family)